MKRFKIIKSILTLGCIMVFGSLVYGQQVPKMSAIGMGYLEYLPAGYSTSTQTYPCIIFLHGSGERGDGSPGQLAKVANNGTPKFIKQGANMCFTVGGKTECFIVLSPQQSTSTASWKGAVMPFVKWALTNYRIDPSRVYLTGLSMGGQGTWVGTSDVQNAPNYFAAIAPVSAYGTPQMGCTVGQKDVPVWAFHGDLDKTLTLNQGLSPYNGMLTCAVNSDVTFTTIVGGAHNGFTWDRAYSPTNTYYTPNLYQWFLGHKLGVTLPQPPVVNAGVDKSITLPTNSVSLTGSASDPDGTIASRLWTRVSGPNIPTIVSPSSLTTNITGLIAGTYVFSLSATDNSGTTSTDQVTVTVLPAPPKFPPVANAGADKSITEPTNSIGLTGSGTDSDGVVSSYLWTQVSGPNTATFTGASTTALTASNLTVGSYTFSLTVTDNDGLSSSDQAIITVLAAPPNNPPTANAGADKSITLPTDFVALAGSGSDTDGTIASYLWSQNSGPSTATITPNNLGPTTVSNLFEGVYVFTLTVTDNKGSIGVDQVIVTVLPIPPNAPPTASAGSDVVITLPTNSSTLSGSGNDSDGTIASYLWIQTSGPSTATIASSANPSTGISNMIAGNYLFTLTVTDDKGSQGSDQVLVTVLPIPPNQPPTASAGTDLNITLPVNSVSLTGSGNDTDGTISSYLWTLENGPSAATIVSANQSTTQINGLVAGVYTFELTVTDNKGSTGSDQILVTVFPQANVSPTVNAGSDQSITLPTSSVSVTAVGADSDGTIASYQWDQVSGPSATIFSNATSAATTASGLASGIYIYSVTVTDNNGAKASDQVQVTVAPQPPNQPPVANAGADKILTLPTNSTTLNGSGTDSDGTVNGYGWVLISGPAQVSVGPLDQPALSVFDLDQGIYVFELTIFDDQGSTATDEVKIFVNAADQPPVANAGADKVITLPTSSVSFAGIGSDPDGTIVSYLWEQTNGPAAATIASKTSAATAISGLVQGIYVFNFWVTDNDGLTEYDQVQVTVNPAPPNVPPVASTGPDLTITLPVNSVLIAGSGTDSDGTITAYQWSQISGPNTAATTNVNLASITFSNLTDGIYVFRLTVTDNKGAKGQKDINVRVNPQPPNFPPVAAAGPDAEIILPINSTSLTGSGTDADGTIATYKWTQTNGPTIASFSNPNTGNTNATNLAEGIYVFKLTVTDNKGATGSDEVKITVKPVPANLPPIASAGGNVIITSPATSTTLAGNGTDSDGTISGYNWQQVSGPTTATTSSPTVKDINLSNLALGIYVFRLTVTDNDGSTGFDEVNIRVQPVPANQPPTANAGGNKIITLPTFNVVFTGNGTDPDGTIATYTWIQQSGPSTASVSGGSTNTLSATNLLEGTYIFRLTVTDNIGATGFDQVNVRVNPPLPNVPPVVNAGGNITITLPNNSVMIAGVASDADGTIANYTWTQPSGPNTATLTGASTASLTATGLVAGNYIFRLTVTDDLGSISFDEVLVTVNPLPPNQPPVANAGADQLIITPPNTAILTGTSSDSDGTIASTVWAQVSGPATATFGNAASLTTTISDLQQGSYLFQLKATDNSGDTGIDEVIINVVDNLLPVAFAGNAINLVLPNTSTQLLGGATDPDGTIVSFSWKQISGAAATTSATDQKELTVTGLQPGVYVFELTVTDDKGAESRASVTVSVFSNNTPPTADAGEDATIELPTTTIDLHGAGTDSDGTIISFSWAQISGPDLASLSDASLPDLTVSDLIEGSYTFELTATDNGGFTGTDQITVTVSPEVIVAKVPKIFSPNGDGNNDQWTWANGDVYKDCKLVIYNRFGKLVYEKMSYDSSWDGRSTDGQVLEEEAYYYIIKCEGSQDVTGGVRIVR